MRSLSRRVLRIEDAARARKNLAPYRVATDDGLVSATITPLRNGGSYVELRADIETDFDEALTRIEAQLPDRCSIVVFPRALSLDEWAAYAEEIRKKQEQTQEKE